MRLSSSCVKICQIPYVSFETTSQFLFRFFIILQCHYLQLLCKFVAHAFSTLDKRIPWKYQFWHFQLFWWKFASCHFPNHKSVFLQILQHSLVSWDITPLYFFSWNVIYFNKSSLSKYKFGEISLEQLKVWNFALLWAPFVKII